MKRWLLFLMCMLLLAGCGQNKKQAETQDMQPEYRENTLVIRLSEEFERFTLLTMEEDYFYYLVSEVTGEEDSYEETVRFYRQSFESNSKPQDLKLTLINPIFRDFCVKEETLYLLLGKETDGELQYFIQVYDLNGAIVTEVSLEGLLNERPEKILCLQDGNIGVLTPKQIVIVNLQGQHQETIECPGKEFRGITELLDGRLALAYQDNSEKSVCLIRYNPKDDSMTTPVNISGDGRILLAQAEGVLYLTSEDLILLSEEKNTESELLSLAGRNVAYEQIVCIQGDQKEYRVLCYTGDYSGVKYICYSLQEKTNADSNSTTLDSAKYDAYGRRYIYLYDVWGSLPKDSTNPVDAFNEQSDAYQVVVKDYHYDPNNSDIYDAGKMIALGEYPDLLLSPYNALVDNLLKKNCLENIAPYVESSKNLSLSDMDSVVIEAYTKQGILFALPDFYTLDALYGGKETLGEGGWTAEEFLDWMVKHPTAGGVVNSRRQIYDAYIDGVLDQYIDWETKKASFQTQEFQNILIKTKELNRKDNYSKQEALEFYENEKDRISDLIYHPGVLAIQENTTGRELVIKGYPSASGEPIVYISSPALSILTESEVKEGAYEFLEFYLTYTAQVMGDSGSDIGTTRFFTVNSYQEKGIQGLLEADNYLGEPCVISQEQLDVVLQVLPYARLRDYSRDTLKDIIWEETVLFLDDKKDVNSTCQAIQSRVQLYLDEQGD